MPTFLDRAGLPSDKRVALGCSFRDAATEAKTELVLRKWAGQWRWPVLKLRSDCGRSTDRTLEVSSSLSRKTFSLHFLGKEP